MHEYSWKRRLAWIFLQTGTLTIFVVCQALIPYPSEQEWPSFVFVMVCYGALIIPHWLLHRRWFHDYLYRGDRDYGICSLIIGSSMGICTVFTITLFLSPYVWFMGLPILLVMLFLYRSLSKPDETIWNPRWVWANILAAAAAGSLALMVSDVWNTAAYGEVIQLGTMGGIFGLIYSLVITVLLPWVVQYQRKE